MLSQTDIAAKLDEARALIEKLGWTQDEFARDGQGQAIESDSQQPTCFCALGAISMATLDYCDPDALSDRSIDGFDRVSKALAAALGVRFSHEVAKWNDAPGRTQAEVIEAFRKAAELARAVQA